MHKVYRSYKYTGQRSDEVVVAAVGDACRKKEVKCRSWYGQKRKGALNGNGVQSTKGRRIESAMYACRKTVRQTEQRNLAEQ
jgi:hypothetical protein